MLRYRKWMCALAALVCSPALVLAGQPYPGVPYQSANPNQQTAEQIAHILSTSGGLHTRAARAHLSSIGHKRRD